MKKISLFVIIFISIIFSTNLVFAQTSPYKDIKSVAYAFPNGYNGFIEPWKSLQNDLSNIKALGFNTVWLYTVWSKFEPQALPTPVFDKNNFTNLKSTLTLLKSNGVQAILPINYLWSADGLHPVGINTNSWLTDSTQYQAFKAYVEKLLTEINDFNDMVYIVIFIEGTETNIANYQMNDADSNRDLASLLRNTLGNLPNQISPDLKSKFRFGYHIGSYLLANLELSQSASFVPSDNPTPYDFISIANYDTFLGYNDVNIIPRVDQQVSRVKQFYPNQPIVIGEYGATSCSLWSGTEDTQADTDQHMISYFLSKGYGFNLWGWQSLPPPNCANGNVDAGLGIYNSDGSPKKVVSVLKNILNPSPTPTPSPTATPSWLAGDINGDGKVDIFDYNLLVTDFGKTGNPGFTKADIDNNGKVDIFDYNILVTNFGKKL